MFGNYSDGQERSGVECGTVWGKRNIYINWEGIK